MELLASGHSYFGLVNSAQEAHVVLEASKQGLIPRVTRRLTDDERLRFVRAGAVFVWEEEEAGIRRWTDHIKWSPSRVAGAFLTYTELPPRGDDTLIKQSFLSTDANGTKMHLIAYTSKTAFSTVEFPTVSRDPLLGPMMAQRAVRDPRDLSTPLPFAPSPSTSASISSYPSVSSSSTPLHTAPMYSGHIAFTPPAENTSTQAATSSFSLPPTSSSTGAELSATRIGKQREVRRASPGIPGGYRPPLVYTAMGPFGQPDDPLRLQLPSIRMPATDSLEYPDPRPILSALNGTFVDEDFDMDDADDCFGDDDACRPNWVRGAEDQRQLSLLGISL